MTIKREPLLLQHVSVTMLEIKSKFQFFKLTSGKKVIVYQKGRHGYHLFSLLNFPRSHFEFV